MKVTLGSRRFFRSGEDLIWVDWLLSMPNPVGYDYDFEADVVWLP
jgi:hypothetical protein